MKATPELIALVDKLLDELTYPEIAERLNARGFRPGGSVRLGKGEARFTALRVSYLVNAYGLRPRFERLRARGLLTKQEAAARLKIHVATLISWAKHGIVTRYAYNAHAYLYGTSRDTPEFAVDAVEKWWRTEGQQRYQRAEHLAILTDGGGSNSASARAHYPSGTSKWNPIEHRLFSEISKNWAGRPLDSCQTILNYLRTTTTTTGFRVTAHLVKKTYKKGIKISNAQMSQLDISTDNALPKWNYPLRPN